MSLSGSGLTFSSNNIYPILTPCRLAATSDLGGTYFNGTTNNGVGATLTISSLTAIDSVNLNLNDAVLLQNQTATNTNGIYVVSALGTNTILQRRPDFQNIEQLLAGQSVAIAAGSTNAGKTYVLVEPKPIQFGVNAITFVAI